MLLVTESLTFMAGKSKVPAAARWRRRFTPVVVSSLTPRMPLAIAVHMPGLERSAFCRVAAIMPCSSLSSGPRSGTAPSRSACTPRWTSSVASPPSSTIMFGPWPSGHLRACSVHHQYSSSVSPFQANTGTPREATAAAAWSWVEKTLHDAQRTWAPSSTRVSIRTAVCTVMCSDPVTRAPSRGLWSRYSWRSDMSPGISTSARSISRRPKSARPMSATL